MKVLLRLLCLFVQDVGLFHDLFRRAVWCKARRDTGEIDQVTAGRRRIHEFEVRACADAFVASAPSAADGAESAHKSGRSSHSQGGRRRACISGRHRRQNWYSSTHRSGAGDGTRAACHGTPARADAGTGTTRNDLAPTNRSAWGRGVIWTCTALAMPDEAEASRPQARRAIDVRDLAEANRA